MPSLTRTAVADARAYSNGDYFSTGGLYDLGDTSATPDSYIAIQFSDIQVDQGSTINSASFVMTMYSPPSLDATYHAFLYAAINPTFPANSSALRGAPRTGAKNDHTTLASEVPADRTWSILAALQEQVNKETWVKGGNVVVLLKGATSGTRRSIQRSHLNASGAYAQVLSIDFSPPAPALPYAGTGDATRPERTATGLGDETSPTATGSAEAERPMPTASGTGSSGDARFTAEGSATRPIGGGGTGKAALQPSFTGSGGAERPLFGATGEAQQDIPPQIVETQSPKSELANAVARHLLGLLPPGRSPREGGYAWFTVIALAALIADADQAAIDMVLDWSPSSTPNDKALGLIGEARGLKRGAGEPFEAYRARVVNAAEFWRMGGTVRGVASALKTAGYGVKVTEWFRTDTSIWAEFSLELYPDRTDFTADTWNDGEGFWDDGTPWNWGISKTEAARIQEIISETKAAHSKVRGVFYQHGGPQDYWNDEPGKWDDDSTWHGLEPIQII